MRLALLAALCPLALLLTACGGELRPSAALTPPQPGMADTATATSPGLPGAVPSARGNSQSPVDARSPATGSM